MTRDDETEPIRHSREGPLRIRVVRPFGPWELETEGARFSTDIALGEADALVCEWAPSDEIWSFDGPAVWYTCEPRTNPRMGVLRQPTQRRALLELKSDQLLHHAHHDPTCRVPHVTHQRSDLVGDPPTRLDAAVGVASNYGGAIRNRWPDMVLRNEFLTTPGVHLFGRRSKWKHYRPRWWSWPGLPTSWQGEVAPDDKLELLARYDVAICLENTSEPGYFTEKFVDAVRAGCVPVYHAHPTVRDSVLRGARWVDPVDFDFDPRRTLDHALSLEREEVAAANARWLLGPEASATSERAVWRRIAEILAARLERGAGDAATGS